jgi:NAD(P)-dependent dehydrogenase (short-subunit alcohol dehydrogenase family)
MSDKKAWLVTGAGRGLGVDIAKAALAAGHAVVATGRNTEKVSAAIGEHDDLLAVKLDVTAPADGEAAVALRSTGSAGSMCWSTTRATSTPASSRS